MTHPALSATPIADEGVGLHSACGLCSQACGVLVDVSGGRIVKVRGDPDNPHSRGYVCNKAASIPYLVDHDQRVTEPLRRRPDGSFEAVSWDTAISEIAAKLNAIRGEHGPQSIGVVGLGGQTNHLDISYGLAFLDGLGSHRWFNTLAQEKTQHFLVEAWMFGEDPYTLIRADEENTAYLMIIGANPRVSNTGVAAPSRRLARLGRDEARTLIVVDPRLSETARRADVHLRIRPGTDAYLMMGMVSAILKEGWEDRAFLDEHGGGTDTLRARFKGIDPAEMAARCGIEAEDLLRVAEGFAKAPSACIHSELGLEQSVFSTLNSYLVRLLVVITGNLGRLGGAFFHASVIAAPKPTPPRETHRAFMSGIPWIRLATEIGMFSPLLVPEELLNDHPERLRALMIEGSNPVVSYPESQKWRDALRAAELVVVVDPAMTETAHEADYVLPAPVIYEKWEGLIVPVHFPSVPIHARPPVVQAPSEVLPEGEIWTRLFTAMNLFSPPPWPMRALSRWAGRPTVRQLLTGLAVMLSQLMGRGGTPIWRAFYWLYLTLGPKLPAPNLLSVWVVCVFNALHRRKAALRVLGPAFRFHGPFRLAEVLWQRILAHPEGVEFVRLDPAEHLRDNIRTPDRRVRLAPEPMVGEIQRALDAGPITSPDYPLVLSAGLRHRWSANSLHRDPRWRKGKGPHMALSIHPDDADALNISDGEEVLLETPTGGLRIPALYDLSLRPGHVSVPNVSDSRTSDGSQAISINEITSCLDRDPFTGCPWHKNLACRVSAGAASE